MPTPIDQNPNQPQGQEYDYSAYNTDQAQAVAQESYRIREGGGGGADILIPEIVGEYPRFEPSAPQSGTASIWFDVIMAAAGYKHPMVVNGRIQPNAMVHICWLYIHKSLGQGWWLCPARTYGMRCPACEVRSKVYARSDLGDEQIKNLAKPYNTGTHANGIYNVVVHQNPQAITWQEPVKFWTINNMFVESVLQSKAKSDGLMEGTGYINYFSPMAGPQGGRHIKVDIFKKGQYDDYSGHTFYQRANPIPPHVLAQARSLSDFLYVGQANKERVLAGQEGPPTRAEFDAYYDELKAAVDIVEEGQRQGLPGPEQPTGQGYAIGGYAPPQPQYQTPAPQPVMGVQIQVPFPDHCLPLGAHHNEYGECAACTVKVECGQAAPAPAPQPTAQSMAPPPPAEEPRPAPAPAPAPASAGPAPAPTPTPAPAGPTKPLPRRSNQ